MITSLGPGGLADGFELGDGFVVAVGLGVDDANGDGDGLAATSGLLEVGEESEPTGLAWPHAAMTMAQAAMPVAHLAVIRSIGRGAQRMRRQTVTPG